MKVSGNISPLSVVALLAVTLIGALLMIMLCNGGLLPETIAAAIIL